MELHTRCADSGRIYGILAQKPVEARVCFQVNPVNYMGV